MDDHSVQRARDLVAEEARLLDERQWDAWLALFTEDAVLWVPTWRDEDSLTEDPSQELSFMHLQGRGRLAERVFRITSGRSAASLPLPRTSHLVTGSLVSAGPCGMVQVRSAFASHVWFHKEPAMVTYTGHYEHLLAADGDGWRIARKKVVLINDRLASQVDFFYL
jgi:3-phenylpropionate/cinnamic acid dioxygenase small subunit